MEGGDTTTTHVRALLVRGGTVWDGLGGDAHPNPGLLLGEGRIRQLGPDRGATREVEPFDADGLTILPGLIDAHVHLTFTASDDVVGDLARESDELLLLRGARNARQMLSSGVTTARDCGGRNLITASLKLAIQAGITPGPRLLISLMPITTTGGHCHYLGLEADTLDDLRVATRRLAKSGADFVKVMASGGNMTPGSNVLLPQYGADELRTLVAEAHRLGRQVAAHAHPVEAIRSAVLAGADTIEHCHWQEPAGGVSLDEAVVAEMVRRGTFVDPTLAGGYRIPAPGESAADRRRGELRSGRVAALRRMIELGVRVIAGTDAGARRTAFDDFALSLELLVAEAGLTPADALLAATRTSAEALGLAHEIGTIEAGKRADLVLVEGDPLADVSATRRVAAVIQAGRVFRPGDD